jgi:hypothetical protein
VVKYTEWRNELMHAASKGPTENVLAPVLAQFSDDWLRSLRNPVYDCTNVKTGLEVRALWCTVASQFIEKIIADQQAGHRH